MAFGDFVKSIYVKIKVDGAEEAKSQMAQIAAEADKLNHSDPTIKVQVDKDGFKALKGLNDQLKALREPKVSKDLQDLAARFHMLAATTDDARVRTRALRGELDALGKDMERGWISKMLGGIGGLFTGSTTIPLVGGIPGIGGLLSNPYGFAAALASLPFLAQAAGSGIVLGLGGALTALGVYAESGTRSVKYQFAQLVSGKDGISATLKGISPAFGDAITTILSAARTFLPEFIRDFAAPLKAIAQPLASLGVMIAGSLASPQVAASLSAVGRAFGAILKALTPLVPGIFTSIADGFTNIARAVARNPKPIADLIAGFFHLIGILLDVIGWLTNVADYLEQHFIPAWHRTLAFLESWVAAVRTHFLGFKVNTVSVFDAVRNVVLAIWNTMWRETIGAAIHGVQTVETWFTILKMTILQKVSDFPHLLYWAGQELIKGLISGLNSMIPGLGSVLSNIAAWIKSHFPFSPAKTGPLSGSGDMFYAGRAIARGLGAGMDAGRMDVGAAAARMARAVNPGGVMIGAAGGGGLQVVLSAAPGADSAVVRAMWPYLRAEVRIKSGGGPQSVQRALGQVWR